MEEDIKILVELLQGAKDNGMYDNNKYFYSIENLIKGYRELEIKSSALENQNKYWKSVANDSIPKSKAKEKIEELEKELTNEITRNDGFAEYREYAIDILEELMEE